MTQQSFFSSLALSLVAVAGCGGQVLDVGNTKPDDNPGGSAGASSVSGATTSGRGGSGPTTAGAAAGGSKPTSSAGTAGLSAGGSKAVGGSDGEDGGACGCAPDDPELEPVSVIHGSGPDSDYWDLTVMGDKLQDYEGKVVTVRIGSPARTFQERLGSGQARIVDGTFQLAFPKVWEVEVYKQKLVFIDTNDDGVCTPDVDLIYSDFTASEFHLMYVTLNHKDIEPSFWPSFSPASDCETLNAPWPTE